MDTGIHMTESLLLARKLSQHLFIGYTPTQNKKLKRKVKPDSHLCKSLVLDV